MVSHQPEDAEYAASHTAFLQDGHIVALKPTAELFAARDVAGLAAYLASADAAYMTGQGVAMNGGRVLVPQ